MCIDTIIFDIGKVLAGYGWEDYLKSITSEPEVYSILEEAIFKNPAWVEHDKGLLDEEEEIRDFAAAAPGYEKESRAAYENLGKCVWGLAYAEPWVRELKEKGYRVYALSNWPKHIYEQRGDTLDFLELMDGYILSYREHLIKPDPRIFRLLLERYGIDPKRAVFLDDTRANIEAAARLGIRGILFTSQEQARRELKDLGVE